MFRKALGCRSVLFRRVFHTLGFHKVSGGIAVLLLIGRPRSLDSESPTPTLCPGLGFRVYGSRALLALGFMVLG